MIHQYFWHSNWWDLIFKGLSCKVHFATASTPPSRGAERPWHAGFPRSTGQIKIIGTQKKHPGWLNVNYLHEHPHSHPNPKQTTKIVWTKNNDWKLETFDLGDKLIHFSWLQNTPEKLRSASQILSHATWPFAYLMGNSFIPKSDVL